MYEDNNVFMTIINIKPLDIYLPGNFIHQSTFEQVIKYATYILAGTCPIL